MATNEPILPAEEPNVKAENKARKIMMWASVVIAIIVIGVLLYIFAWKQPAIAEGNRAIGDADRIALFEGNDSTALAAYQAVAANHGFDAGNRANLESAIILYRQGEYQQALDYVNNYDATDDVVGPLAYGLKGDCLVNLDKYAEAVKAFDKAISTANNNPRLVPYFLNKKAVVLSAEGKHAEAVKAYKEIEEKYPLYAQRAAIEGQRIQAEALAEI